LISPRLFVLEKEFRFLKVAFLVHGSALLGALLTISLALYMQNAWVLVIGYVGQSVLTCFLSHVLCPFRPNFTIDRNSLNELLWFCRRMFGLSFLTIVSLQTDVFVLGKLVPTAQVGMYALALSLAVQPVGMFGQTISRVLLPAFAEKQDNKQSLRHAMLKLIRATVVLGVPLVAIAAMFAGSILSVVYGSRYAAVAVPFGILCFSQLFRIQACILAVVFLATGQPQLQRRYVIILAALIIGLIYPGVVLFDLAGAAGVILLANAIGVFMQVMWIREQIGLRFLDYAYCWLPGLLGCTVVLASAGVMRLFGVQSLFYNVAVVGLSCIPACVIATLLLKPKYSRTCESRKTVEKLEYSSSV
jgi:O-antigen/teichoic acid export membrane protein